MLHRQVENDLSFEGKFSSFPVGVDVNSTIEVTQSGLGLEREFSGKAVPS